MDCLLNGTEVKYGHFPSSFKYLDDEFFGKLCVRISSKKGWCLNKSLPDVEVVIETL